MEHATGGNSLRGLIDRSRWAFEPTLAALFVAGWSLVALRTTSFAELGAIILLAAAIAVSRMNAVAALAAGGLALVLQLAGFVPGLTAVPWAYVVAGVVVVFATSAYGSRAVRWFGLAAALMLTLATALLLVTRGYLSDLPAAADEGYAGALARMFIPYAVAGSILATLLVGAWILGTAVNRRAVAPGIERSAAEAWLTRQELWAQFDASGELGGGTIPVGSAGEDADDPHPRVFRRLSTQQVSVDLAIAIIFVVLGVVPSLQGSLAEVVILLIFAIALAFRRAAPSVALAVAAVAAVVQMTSVLGVLSSDIAILAVLYATAAYGGRITRWVGLASAGVGAVVAAAYLSVLQYGPNELRALIDAGLVAEAVGNFLTILVASAGVLGLAWTVGFLVRTWRRARISRAQAARAVEEQRVAQRSVVVEQERNRIARDMHDVVAHSLAVVIAQADGARYARATDPTAVDSALTTIATTAREALGDVRILLAQLRKDEAQGPQPVLADLDRLREQMRSAGLDVSWTETGNPLPLGTGAQLAVYRIIQEAFTNALRHGRPGGEVLASLQWDETGVVATVENEVRPETPGDQPAGVGHGLPGMRERALLAGGTLTVETPPGRFRVVARIPATGPSATGTMTAADAAEGAQA